MQRFYYNTYVRTYTVGEKMDKIMIGVVVIVALIFLAQLYLTIDNIVNAIKTKNYRYFKWPGFRTLIGIRKGENR
jgi:hypothetical protein